MNVKIYSEGKSDVKFLIDLVKFLGFDLSKDNFENLNGKDGIKNPNMILENTVKEYKNLIVIDADNDFSSRKKEVERVKDKHNLDFELFLFPNNKDNGNLETLLLKLAVQEHQEILKCFDNFGRCLTELNKNYFVPKEKDKVFAYMDAILGPKKREKIQPSKRDYANKLIWDLENPYLNPLKKFLEENFNLLVTNK